MLYEILSVIIIYYSIEQTNEPSFYAILKQLIQFRPGSK